MDTEYNCYVAHDYDKSALYDPALHFVEEITDEDFNLCYTFDRTIFYRLIRKLGRNVDESMHVVAFLIWLEKIRFSQNAVYKVIAWPFHLLNQLANEIEGFLRCLQREQIGSEYINLYSVRKLCSVHINLRECHQQRTKILEGVTKIVSEVCMRAFRDIITGDSEFIDVGGDIMWDAYNNGVPALLAPTQMLRGTQLEKQSEDEPNVEPDDRTIFLTFSKGYYVPESEIREFFTRIFGDVIEGIYMQDVSSDEQPLYARMVCHSSANVTSIAPANRKTKYFICGKRIMATKYVKRSRR